MHKPNFWVAGEETRYWVLPDICRISNVVYNLQVVISDFLHDVDQLIYGGPETVRRVFEKQSKAGLFSKWQQHVKTFIHPPKCLRNRWRNHCACCSRRDHDVDHAPIEGKI